MSHADTFVLENVKHKILVKSHRRLKGSTEAVHLLTLDGAFADTIHKVLQLMKDQINKWTASPTG